ncbi:MAG: alpha/beta hydrolase [Deltaproteobacteria bacterium]|nr:alpha/beta hydrolase [Deltaproteobacteria bacterium]
MRIQVDDVRLFFDVEGPKLVPDGPTMRERPTLLLLHGGPGFDHSGFKPLFAALTDIVQVIYLDHRGNGRSDYGAPDQWNLDRWAEDIHTFCEMLEIERPFVLGQSFGGFVALAYATRYPNHPGKLILSSTHARFRSDRALAAFLRLGGPQVRDVAQAFFDNPTHETGTDYLKICLPLYTQRPQDPDVMARTKFHEELGLSFLGGEWRTFDLLPALTRIQCPTLVMAGEEDPITPMADAEDMVRALPTDLVRLARFPGCGHGVFRDNPEACFKVLRQFLLEE